MATWERYKAVSMAQYPSLFPEEADLLDHTFFTNGNGLEWYKGQLIDVLHPDEPNKSVEEYAKQGYKHRQKRSTINGWTHSEYDSPDQATARALELERRVHYVKKGFYGDSCRLSADGKLIRKIYPICQYSRIMSLPDDIQQDWLEAAWAVLSLDPALWTRTTSDEEYLDKASRRIMDLMKSRVAPKIV